MLKTQAIELLQARRSERQFCSGGTSLLHVHCTGSGTQEPSIASSACADSALLIMSRVVRNIRFVVPLPAPKHLCSKRRDQKCKTLWGGYADDPGTDGARHWAKWRGDRAEATGQRARPKADGQSCTLATPRGSSIRVPIGRLSPEAFSRGVFASGRETLPQRENWLSPPHPERPIKPQPEPLTSERRIGSSALALDWLSSGASNAMGGRRTSSRSGRRRRAGTDLIRSIHMSDES